MSRCYTDHTDHTDHADHTDHTDRVEVLRRNDEPAHFLWRSRLYVVRGVLAHWVETSEWWRSPLAGALTAREPAERMGEGPGAGSASSVAVSTDAIPGRSDLDSPHGQPQEGLEDEREIWRVEASSGRRGAPGVYDLCFAGSSGAWTLMRTAD